MKKFKSKKNKNNFSTYVLLFLISIFLSYFYINDIDIFSSDNIFSLIKLSGLNYKNNEEESDYFVSYIFKESTGHNLKVEDTKTEEDEEIFLEEDSYFKPLVYLYNTHNEEKYASNLTKGYNISSNVMLANNILKEYLEDLEIDTLVESRSVAEYLKNNNLKYGKSYQISRVFLEEAYNENNTLKYFFDIHRDSSIYSETILEIDGKNYAKLLFVIGEENTNYSKNLILAERMKDKLSVYNEKLVRGIIKKSGKNVNGIYNQDFNENVLLIEVGGQYNSINEVNNTLSILAKVIADIVKEDETSE